jgi:hypothetical protein
MLCFEDGDVGGEAFAVLYPRTDHSEEGDGVACFVRGNSMPLGRLCSVSLVASGLKATLYAAATAGRVPENDLCSRMRAILAHALLAGQRKALIGLLARQAFPGEDTLGSLSTPVFIKIDEAMPAGDDGLVLVGWCLAWRRESGGLGNKKGTAGKTA